MDVGVGVSIGWETRGVPWGVGRTSNFFREDGEGPPPIYKIEIGDFLHVIGQVGCPDGIPRVLGLQGGRCDPVRNLLHAAVPATFRRIGREVNAIQPADPVNGHALVIDDTVAPPLAGTRPAAGFAAREAAVGAQARLVTVAPVAL